MKSLSAQIDLLTSHAKVLINSKADYIIVLEEYAQAFVELEPKLIEAAQDPSLKAKLQQLEGLHSQVMARVEADKLKIRNDIASLKKKGKIVITYTDQLPKRISLGTKRKV